MQNQTYNKNMYQLNLKQWQVTTCIYEVMTSSVRWLYRSDSQTDWNFEISLTLLVTQFFFIQHDPYSNLTNILSRWSFWASLIKIGPKLWPLEYPQGFSIIWPTHLVFDQTRPIFELEQDIVMIIILSEFDKYWTKTVTSRVFIKINILKNFHDDWMHNVACIMLTRFFYDLAYWLSFWPDMTHI